MKPLPIALSFCSVLVLWFFGLYLRDFELISFAILGGADWRLSKGEMEFVATIPILVGSLFVILARRFGPKDKCWAYATIGALIGFCYIHSALDPNANPASTLRRAEAPSP